MPVKPWSAQSLVSFNKMVLNWYRATWSMGYSFSSLTGLCAMDQSDMFDINRIWYQVCRLDSVVNMVLCTSLICVRYRWSLHITHIKLILEWYNFNGVNCQFDYLKLHISWNGLIFSWYRLCVCVSIWYMFDIHGLYITYIRLILDIDNIWRSLK